MDESLFEELIEMSWRRKLTPEEEVQLQSWLASHPADAERWETESGLNQALERLKPIVPSSNFTAQVLQRVELELQAEQRAGQRPGFVQQMAGWFRIRARGLAYAALLLFASGIGYHRYRENTHHQIAQGIHAFSTVATVTQPEVLVDFDTVREFSQVVVEVNPTDEALFVLLGE